MKVSFVFEVSEEVWSDFTDQDESLLWNKFTSAVEDAAKPFAELTDIQY